MDWTWIALILLFLWTGGGFGNLRNLIGDFYVDLKSKMDNLEEKMDDLRNEIGEDYVEDRLKCKMDEIRRTLERIEESGMTKEESEEED